MQKFDNLFFLKREHEGMFIRLDGKNHLLASPPERSDFFRIRRVRSDGINIRKITAPENVRTSFLGKNKFFQRVEVYTATELQNIIEN